MGIRIFIGAIGNTVGGIGRGSLFGYGRMGGVHHPLDSDFSKARDPFINIKTLCRLSYSDKTDVRSVVAANMGNRLVHISKNESPLKYLTCNLRDLGGVVKEELRSLSEQELKYVFSKFNREALAEAIIHIWKFHDLKWRSDRLISLRYHVNKFANTITQDELWQPAFTHMMVQHIKYRMLSLNNVKEGM
jgi:hypothetical protein